MTPADRLYELRFAVDKSLRYHQRRRGFYELIHRWISIGVILAGSAAIATDWPKSAGVLSVILGTLDFVFGYSHRARDHEALYRRFTDLSIKARSSSLDDSAITELENERDRIEADEPPIYWLLEADCDNETTIAWGLDQKNGLVHLTNWQRGTMHFLRSNPCLLGKRISKTSAL